MYVLDAGLAAQNTNVRRQRPAANQATDRLSCLMVKILLACRSGASSPQVTTVAAVTDSTWPDMTRDNPGDRPRAARRRKQYLPSAQVVNELASLGPDLGKLAEELRKRLTEGPADPGR